MPFLLGLTGNIGCGKSTVGALLAERHGAEYLDADLVVRALYAPGTPETRAIAERFGLDLLQRDGTIDRRRLGDRVMADPAARLALEQLLDPSIRPRIMARIAASQAPVFVVDAIRLFEGGLAEECDATWVVACDREQQLRRLAESRGLTPEQAALRVDAQRPQAEKIGLATAVIYNRGSLDELAQAVADAWARTVAPRLVL
jgi:dephospho-CoA kinase